MTFDGRAQDEVPDITTRGMATGPARDPQRRFYLDLYPALKTASAGPAKAYCEDRKAPRSRPLRSRSRLRGRLVTIGGSASDSGCRGGPRTVSQPGAVRSVKLTVALRIGGKRCRYLRAGGGFTKVRSCKRRVWLQAKGGESWKLRVRLRHRLAPGQYRARSRAVDTAGNERASTGSPPLRLRVRRTHRSG